MPRHSAALLLLLALDRAAGTAGTRSGLLAPRIVSEEPQASVQTLASVPAGSGRFHYVETDFRNGAKHVYVSGTPSHIIWRLDLATDRWEVVAGRQDAAGWRDGPANASLLGAPTALCMMPHRHLAFVDYKNACVRKLDPQAHLVATLAGNCSVPGFADGRPAEARFGRSITSLKCLPNCSLLVPDAETGHLRLFDPNDQDCSTAAAGAVPRAFPRWIQWLLASLLMLAVLTSLLLLAASRWLEARAELLRCRLQEQRVLSHEAGIAQALQRPLLGSEAGEGAGEGAALLRGLEAEGPSAPAAPIPATLPETAAPPPGASGRVAVAARGHDLFGDLNPLPARG